MITVWIPIPLTVGDSYDGNDRLARNSINITYTHLRRSRGFREADMFSGTLGLTTRLLDRGIRRGYRIIIRGWLVSAKASPSPEFAHKMLRCHPTRSAIFRTTGSNRSTLYYL